VRERGERGNRERERIRERERERFFRVEDAGCDRA
jgi:hypothetical protein